jgi:hypothetical protein
MLAPQPSAIPTNILRACRVVRLDSSGYTGNLKTYQVRFSIREDFALENRSLSRTGSTPNLMSHIIAPEVTINATPLLLDLCSEAFDPDSRELTLPDLEEAARAIKEACSVSSRAINNAKANLLFAYMEDPACRRWLKKEFQRRVDCDNTLLTTIARKAGYKFYTQDRIVMEEITKCDDETPVEVIAERAGCSEKAVERVKTKLKKKLEDELLTKQIAIEVALASDKDDSPRPESEALDVAPLQYVSAEAPKAEADEADEGEETQSRAPASIPAATIPPKQTFERSKPLPTMDQVKVITTKVKQRLEADYQKEIEILKNLLTEKDAEIERLKKLLED